MKWKFTKRDMEELEREITIMAYEDKLKEANRMIELLQLQVHKQHEVIHKLNEDIASYKTIIACYRNMNATGRSLRHDYNN